jgi:hypothetical protein
MFPCDGLAFLRFASSGSEDSEEEEENRRSSPAASWSEENALRSAQLMSRTRATVQVSDTAPSRGDGRC